MSGAHTHQFEDHWPEGKCKFPNVAPVVTLALLCVLSLQDSLLPEHTQTFHLHPGLFLTPRTVISHGSEIEGRRVSNFSWQWDWGLAMRGSNSRHLLIFFRKDASSFPKYTVSWCPASTVPPPWDSSRWRAAAFGGSVFYPSGALEYNRRLRVTVIEHSLFKVPMLHSLLKFTSPASSTGILAHPSSPGLGATSSLKTSFLAFLKQMLFLAST